MRDSFACNLWLVHQIQSKIMQPTQEFEAKIIITVYSIEETQQPPKKPKINSWTLKVISAIVVTLISWLAPEAAIALFLTRLFLIWLQWRNQA